MAILHSYLLSLLVLAWTCLASPFSDPNQMKSDKLREIAGLVSRQNTGNSSTAGSQKLAATEQGNNAKTNALNTTLAVLESALNNITDRQFSLAVCGDSQSTGVVATDSRTADLWTGHNMDDWIANALKPYIASGWKAADGTQYSDIQDIILFLMGADGSDKCDEIIDPNCSGQGLNWNVCLEHPEAHFWWFANTHWAHYLYKMQSSLTITDLATPLHEMTTQFFTPQKNPQQLLVPFGIVGGVAGAIGSVFAPAGIISGAAALANAIVTQAGLNRPDPLMQWGEVSDQVSQAFKNITTAFQDIFKSSLRSFPNTASDILTDIPNEPPTLKSGLFAGEPEVGSLNDALTSGIAAAAINSLWSEDKVFLMIMDDTAWGKGAGQACQANPAHTTCIDGVAYMLFRWMTTQTKEAVTPGNSANPTELDESEWFVWGAMSEGSVNGQSNSNQLGQYGLTTTQIVTSIESTWQNYGQQFPFTGQEQAIQNTLNSHPPGLSVTDFMFFSLPVCDLRFDLGSGKSINHNIDGQDVNPLGVYGACLCTLDPKWPIKQYPLSEGLPPSICKKEAITG